MKLSVFIGGIAAIVCSFMGILILSSHLSDQAYSISWQTATTDIRPLKDPLADLSVAYFQGFAFPKQAGPGLPVRLTIPGINVDAAVEYVGLTADGAMDTPKKRSNVAWFEPGQIPGDIGTAVIAGHYGRQYGKGSAFDSLHKLRKGDRIYIEDDTGATIAFVVRESRRFDATADATDVFSSDDGKAHLNFITCEGLWDKSAKQYPSRLVVFTDKE